MRDCLEALGASVEVVGTVVDGEAVGFAVYHEMAFGDAVGKAAGAFAEAGAIMVVALCLAIAEDYVSEIAVTVRHVYADYSGTETAQDCGRAAVIGNGITVDRLSFGGPAPEFS